jgi:hypothetical protein
MAARTAFLAVVAIVASINLGCGGKIESEAPGNGGKGAGDETSHLTDAASSEAPGLAIGDGSAANPDATTTGGDGGPCAPVGMGPNVGGSFLSMSWQSAACAWNEPCVSHVDVTGCALSVQKNGALTAYTIAADDCARLAAWMTSAELISAVKRQYDCTYSGGNMDLLDVHDSNAQTHYKMPSGCSDPAWVDHRACMAYLADKYAK